MGKQKGKAEGGSERQQLVLSFEIAGKKGSVQKFWWIGVVGIG